jgi:hypothetical protein
LEFIEATQIDRPYSFQIRLIRIFPEKIVKDFGIIQIFRDKNPQAFYSVFFFPESDKMKHRQGNAYQSSKHYGKLYMSRSRRKPDSHIKNNDKYFHGGSGDRTKPDQAEGPHRRYAHTQAAVYHHDDGLYNYRQQCKSNNKAAVSTIQLPVNAGNQDSRGQGESKTENYSPKR